MPWLPSKVLIVVHEAISSLCHRPFIEIELALLSHCAKIGSYRTHPWIDQMPMARFQPALPLDRYVECFWRSERSEPQMHSEHILPSGRVQLVVALHDRPFVIGPAARKSGICGRRVSFTVLSAVSTSSVPSHPGRHLAYRCVQDAQQRCWASRRPNSLIGT